LLLAAGELRAAVALPLGEPREQLVDLRRRPAAASVATPPGEHSQMLVHRQRAEEPPSLRHVADPELRDLVGSLADQLLILEADGAADARGRDSHDRVAERRLAHSVAADHRRRPAGTLERDLLEGAGRPVPR